MKVICNGSCDIDVKEICMHSKEHNLTVLCNGKCFNSKTNKVQGYGCSNIEQNLIEVK